MSNINESNPGEDAATAFLPSVPLSCAVLCVDCERITVSYNDACPVCGSRSLLNVAQILGGTLTPDRVRRVEKRLEIARCA